jgi:hypothetical protein
VRRGDDRHGVAIRVLGDTDYHRGHHHFGTDHHGHDSEHVHGPYDDHN